MPWTTEDVDKHKKGLTDKQKAQWVRIANAALEACKKKGGEDCEGSAIRQASGVVGNNADTTENFTIHSTQSKEYTIENRKHQGRSHVVVPVVMMVEGVHSGNKGPLLHMGDDLGKFPESWNGIPVVVQHPEKDGKSISANSPDVIDNQTVGRVYNTRFENGRLKAEAWLDEERLGVVSPTAMKAIKAGQPLEVSIGVFTDEENSPGVWNNEEYVAIARNHRPDHLALLPGGTGACSWNDGCGIRVNSNNNKEGGVDVTTQEMIKQIELAGFSVNSIGNNADVGYQAKIEAAYRALENQPEKAASLSYRSLEELYDNYLIYRTSENDGIKFFKQSYSLKDGKIELSGDPTAVTKQVNYINVQSATMKRTNFNNNSNKGGNVMSDVKITPCCLAKVEQIMTNGLTGFTDADKEWLLTQEESTLDKILNVKKPEPIQVNKEQVTDYLTKTAKTVADYVALMPKEMQAQVNAGLELSLNHRKEVIASILTNTKEVWKEEELVAKDTETLEKIAKSTQPVTDYSALGGVPAGKEEEVLMPPMAQRKSKQ